MKIKICPSCGHKHDTTDIVCPYCKHSYTGEKIVCKNCGAYLKLSDKVCYVCGDVVDEPMQEISSVEQEEVYVTPDVEAEGEVEYVKEDKPMKKSKAPLIISVLLVVVIIVVAVGVCFKTGVLEIDKILGNDETTPSTQAVSTETTTESTTEATAETTEPGIVSYFKIEIPEEWTDKYTVIQNDECIDYYETYNHENYQCGKLFTVYVVDADDTEYEEYNYEKKVYSSDGTKMILVVTPQDVQFDLNDELAMTNYSYLSAYTDRVIESIEAN